MKKTDENISGHKSDSATPNKRKSAAGRHSQFGRRRPAPEGKPMLQQPTGNRSNPRHEDGSPNGNVMVAARGDDDLMSTPQKIRKTQAQQQQQPQAMQGGEVTRRN